MTTENRPTRVVVDGRELNTVTVDGTAWRFRSIQGWHSGAGVAVPQNQRVVSHGQFGEPGHRLGKTVTIVGDIQAPDRALVADAIDDLTALLADGGFGIFEFHDRTHGRRWARVQLFGEPTVDWAGGPTARYQLQLLAPSPYRFGDTTSTSTAFASAPVGVGAVFPPFPGGSFDFGPVSSGNVGIASATNKGTAPAAPVFKVAGPAPAGGFSIIELGTGNRVTYLGDLPAGSQLVIDPRDASAVIDGTADRSGNVIVSGVWPSVPARTQRDYLFQPSGESSAAVLTIDCTSTYW